MGTPRGESYETFVRENIFTPLGMKDSGYDSNSAVIPHRAAGYVFSKDRFENAGFVHMSVPQGAGALYSTTEDPLEVGASSLRRQDAAHPVARKNDDAVQEQLRI